MSFAYAVGSMGLNEAAKQQAAQRAAQEHDARAALEQREYERQRQLFQEQIIEREQRRREQDAQAAREDRRFDLQQKYRRSPLDHYKETAKMRIANEPAMKMADMVGNAFNNINSQGAQGVQMFDRDGVAIGGSWLRKG